MPLSGATGLDTPSFAMTEQICTISRRRMSRRPGAVDADCLQLIRFWLRDFLDL